MWCEGVSNEEVLTEDAQIERERETMTPVYQSVKRRVSPGKSIELWMENFEQLRYLQQLYEDQILDESEYSNYSQLLLSLVI